MSIDGAVAPGLFLLTLHTRTAGRRVVADVNKPACAAGLLFCHGWE
jgi:hypothetical protein